MSGVCFKCGALGAERPIYTGTGKPEGYVCTRCDRTAVMMHRQMAMDEVEQAQRRMSLAAEKLSAICYGDPARQRLMKLYDKIHAEWYRLKDTNNERWSMDDNYWANRLKEAKKS